MCIRDRFSVKDGSDLTVDGSNGKGEEEPSEGSLADVSDSGAFGISAGVTLTGNNTTAKGGAVSNSGGSLVLKGGTITGNTGAMGAVYSKMCIRDRNRRNTTGYYSKRRGFSE